MLLRLWPLDFARNTRHHGADGHGRGQLLGHRIARRLCFLFYARLGRRRSLGWLGGWSCGRSSDDADPLFNVVAATLKRPFYPQSSEAQKSAIRLQAAFSNSSEVA